MQLMNSGVHNSDYVVGWKFWFSFPSMQEKCWFSLKSTNRL